MKLLNPILIIAVLVGGGIYIAPLEVPYSIETYGKILPAQKWVLTRGTDGQLIATLFNYQTGMSEGYSVSQFAREGAMRFTLNPAVMTNGAVQAGDAVGLIYSSETEERLVELKGQLSLALASLAVNTGGRKKPIIQESEQRLTHAREKVVEQQKQLARIKKMYQEGLISEQEYEIAQGEIKLMGIEVSIAASQLETEKTGEKPEQVNLVHARIKALEQEIATLQKRLKSFTITTPIDGKVSRIFSPETLLSISNTTSFLVYVPIKWEESKYLSTAQNISIGLNGLPKKVKGRVLSMDKEIRLINGEQVIVAIILLTEYSGDLFPGMTARCTIACGPVTVLEYVKRFLTSMAA